MIFGKQQISLSHAVSSGAFAGVSFMLTGEILRDLAALASLLISLSAIGPAAFAWYQRARAWLTSKLGK